MAGRGRLKGVASARLPCLTATKDVNARIKSGHDDVGYPDLVVYSAVQPPSIERLAPVICAASSLHRNSASAATCSEVTNSLVGCASSSTSLMTCSLVMLRAFMVSGI